MAYIPLWCKSNFSFLEGASHPEELIEACANYGLPGMALTDRDGVYGMVEAHRKAGKLGLDLIVGSEITIQDGTILILLAMNRTGYANLCRLITRGRLRSEKGNSFVRWKGIFEHAGNLIALWGGDRSLLAGIAEPFFIAHQLREVFQDRLYALLSRHRRAAEPLQEERVLRRAARYRLPAAAAVEVLYHHPRRRQLQDVLTCIHHKTKLVDAGRLIRSNAQHAVLSALRFEKLFHDQPEAMARTLEIATIIKEALKLLRSSLPATIEIRRKIAADPGTVLADPTQIHQIMMNLCTNAGNAMRQQGGILDVILKNVLIGTGISHRGFASFTGALPRIDRRRYRAWLFGQHHGTDF